MSRPPPAANPVRLRFDAFELDEANASLLRGGQPVALAPTPFNLLCALARQPGALLTKDALLDAVWGHQFVSESVLKTAISDLRTALGDQPREPRFIETVSRRGYRFIAAPTAAPVEGAAAAPPMAPSSPFFVGRADALATMQRAWQRACGGQRALVWVAGEPGIGKTTLIEHFAATLGDALCVRGQCVEHYGPVEPYLPVLEALAELCRKDASASALLRAVAPSWLLQLPWLGSADERDALRRELAGVGAERMLREMGELLDRCTEQRPLLLLTEDLHWSDHATVQLIDHVARRRGPARLMWLASFRLAEVVALDHPLNHARRELRLHRLCEEVVLDTFSESEVAACVARHAPALARDEAFVRALHERTDGLPLFVTTAITEVTRTAQGDAAARARLATVAVPESLVAILEQHLARLDGEQRALLTAAAVCGVEFRVGTLAAVLQRDAASVALACDELMRLHLWFAASRSPDDDIVTDPPYAFRHALVRQLLYERMPPAVRAQLHRDAGAALERERAAGAAVAAAELAMHFERGRQPMAALRWTVEAARAAFENFNPAACLGQLERAAALLPRAPQGGERDALQITLATLQGMAAFQAYGVGDLARGAFERAYALLAGNESHPIRARLLHGFGFVLSLRGEYAQALEVAKRAETLAAGSNDPVLMLAACFLNAHVHHVHRQTHETRAWIERGLGVAETIEPGGNDGFMADPQVTLLGMQAIELVRGGLVRQGRTRAQQARSRATELRQPIARLVAAWQEALFEVRLGNADRVAALADEICALVDEFALEQGRAACGFFRGWAEARQGRAREGFRLIREAYERNLRLGMRAGSSEVLGYAAEALLLAGDADAARAQIQEALQVADELGEKVYLPQLWLLDAAIARARGLAGAAGARRGVDAAHALQAPWLELAALVDLCEHGEASAEERRALAALVDGLPEAADTDLVRRARSLPGKGASAR